MAYLNEMSQISKKNHVFDAVVWWTNTDLKDDQAPSSDKSSFNPTINNFTHPEIKIRNYFHYFWMSILPRFQNHILFRYKTNKQIL